MSRGRVIQEEGTFWRDGFEHCNPNLIRRLWERSPSMEPLMVSSSLGTVLLHTKTPFGVMVTNMPYFPGKEKLKRLFPFGRSPLLSFLMQNPIGENDPEFKFIEHREEWKT